MWVRYKVVVGVVGCMGKEKRETHTQKRAFCVGIYAYVHYFKGIR